MKQIKFILSAILFALSMLCLTGCSVSTAIAIFQAKQVYCNSLPNTQRLLLAKIRKVDPNWVPICGQN